VQHLVRFAVGVILVVGAVAALRDVLLRRNEARYGGPHTPYGPDVRTPA
jgi:hypothetical protein